MAAEAQSAPARLAAAVQAGMAPPGTYSSYEHASNAAEQAGMAAGAADQGAVRSWAADVEAMHQWSLTEIGRLTVEVQQIREVMGAYAHRLGASPADS